jgi:hypothetical protein
MERQRLFDRDWFDFCSRCGAINPADRFDGRLVCSRCSQALERDEARRLGMNVEEASDDEIGEWLDVHHTVCRYLTLVWNESIALRKGQPKVFLGNHPCPWDAYGAKWIPRPEIEGAASEMMQDDELAETIDQAHLEMFSLHYKYSTYEPNPSGGCTITESYWPAVARDPLFKELEAHLWARWERFLPLRAVGEAGGP